MSYQAADRCPTSRLAWPKHSSMQPFPGGDGFIITTHSRWLRLLLQTATNTTHRTNSPLSYFGSRLRNTTAPQNGTVKHRSPRTGEHPWNRGPTQPPTWAGRGRLGGRLCACLPARQGPDGQREEAAEEQRDAQRLGQQAAGGQGARAQPQPHPPHSPACARSAPGALRPAPPRLQPISSYRTCPPGPPIGQHPAALQPRAGSGAPHGRGGMSQQPPRRGLRRQCGVVAVTGLVCKLWFESSQGDFALSCTKGHQAA